MEWWNEILAWFNSTAGWRVFSTAVVPFVAIIIAGLVATGIASGFARRVIELQNRELKAAAIMALIGAGRRAAIWSSLGADEKQHVDSLISESDLRMRLLPVSGAIAAADWSAHELNAMKKNSATFSYQAEQTFFDYRDRLLDWQAKPRRARKLFAFDLVQWRYEDDAVTESSLVAQQQEWAVEHVRPATVPVGVVAPPPTGAPVVAGRRPADAALDESAAAPSGPVTAGTVRHRTAPERSVSGN
jgi:hypothetical protein